MWPDWASRQLEISPWTEMSVKFLARRSRIFPVNSLTVKVLRLGMRLKLSCWVILTNPCSVIRGLWPQWGTARILTGHGCAWSDDEILHSSVRFRICKIAGRSRQGGKNAGKPATHQPSRNSWPGSEFLGQRIIGALLVPKNAYDPPALAIVCQLKTVDATGERRCPRVVPGFVAAKDMGDVAKGLDATDDRTFEKTMLGEVTASAGDILLDGARANVNIAFAVLSGRGECGAGQKQRTKTIPVAVAGRTGDHAIDGRQDAIGGLDVFWFWGRNLGRGIWGRTHRGLLSCRRRCGGGLCSRGEIEK